MEYLVNCACQPYFKQEDLNSNSKNKGESYGYRYELFRICNYPK
jgi:hypothetical protein